MNLILDYSILFESVLATTFNHTLPLRFYGFISYKSMNMLLLSLNEFF